MAGADWAAFATAFFNDTAKYINERKDKASEYEDKLREEAEKSKAIVEGRIQLANTAKSIASRLKSKGATEEMIRAAAASGPTGLVDLDRAFTAAETKFGADIVKSNPDIIASTAISAEQARMSGDNALTTEQFIEQSFGVTAPTTGSMSAGEVTIWDKMLGRNAKERVRAKLDEEMSSMGYSIYDINEAAKSAEYKSLVPGAYVEYKTPKIFTQDSVADETNTLRRLVDNSAAYQTAEAEHKAALKELAEWKATTVAKGDSEDYTTRLAEKEAAVAAAEQKRLAIASGILAPYVTGQAGFYTMDSYQKIMAPMIDEIAGQKGFTQSLFAKPEEETNTPAEEPSVAATEAAAETPAQAVVEAPKVDIQEEGEPIESPKFGKVTPVTGTDGKTYLRTEENGVDKRGKKIPSGTLIPADVSEEELNAMRRAGLMRVPVKTAEIRTAVEQGEKAPITKEEASQMTRAERKAAGLPETPMGAFFRDPSFLAPTARQSLDIKAGAKPDAYYAVKIPGIIGEKRVKGSDLALIPDAVLEKETGAVVIREMAEGEKLPTMGTSRLKRAFGTGLGVKPSTASPVAKPDEEDMTFINP